MSEPPSRAVQRVLALALGVLRDDCAGAFENHLGGAVVLFEADGFACFGEVLFELEDVSDVRAAPAVDGLVLVADDADVRAFAGEQLHQLILRAVGVLVLVDQEIFVTAVVSFSRLRRRTSAGERFRAAGRRSPARWL